MNVGIISQARMNSTRLPGKVLKAVNNIPLLKFHTDRVKTCGYPLFIATSTNHADDPIVDFCEHEGILYYRGSENHVLNRYYSCAQMYNLDVIVRVTSDCPLIDGQHVKDGIEYYLSQNNLNLYISNGLSGTIPRGFDFEIFSFELLELAYLNAKTPAEIEHVTPYLYLGDRHGIIKEKFAYKKNKSEYRVTLDTIEDFNLIERLIKNHCAQNLSIDDIVKILDEHPELVDINAHIEQKKLNS